MKNGVATFTGLTDDLAGYAVFAFSGGGLKVALSQGTVVSPAAVKDFGVTTTFTTLTSPGRRAWSP